MKLALELLVIPVLGVVFYYAARFVALLIALFGGGTGP